MNYLKEINAFYDLVHVKQLSTGQIALWHALMQINNKCAWIEWFTAPNLTLELTSGLSRKGIYNARNALKQHELIDFRSNGTKATKYKLISLLNSTQVSTQTTTQVKSTMQDITQCTTQASTQDTTQGATQDSATLNKLNETKLNETKLIVVEDGGSIFKFVEKEFGFLLSPTQLQTISGWQEEYSDDLIKFAVSEALGRNVREVRYIDQILLNWHKSGIKTVEQARIAKEKFKKRNNNAFGENKYKTREKTDYSANKIRDLDYLVE